MASVKGQQSGNYSIKDKEKLKKIGMNISGKDSLENQLDKPSGLSNNLFLQNFTFLDNSLNTLLAILALR